MGSAPASILKPLVFDPGLVPTQEELAAEAEKKVRLDKRLSDAVKQRKEEITGIFQGCLDRLIHQFQQGEAFNRKARFPRVHPIDFDDFKKLADHDFTVDVRSDEVDQTLRGFIGALLPVVWRNVQIENTKKARSLERFNEALQSRMEQLEQHLAQRSLQLSKCRNDYFQELAHLRGQLYAPTGGGGDPRPPEASEAYFFDPTEFMEEDVRAQLNDKIQLSVKVYHEQLTRLKRRCEDLERDHSEGNGRGGHPDSGGYGFDHATHSANELHREIQYLCNKFGRKATVDALGKQAGKHMLQWGALQRKQSLEFSNSDSERAVVNSASWSPRHVSEHEAPSPPIPSIALRRAEVHQIREDSDMSQSTEASPPRPGHDADAHAREVQGLRLALAQAEVRAQEEARVREQLQKDIELLKEANVQFKANSTLQVPSRRGSVGPPPSPTPASPRSTPRKWRLNSMALKVDTGAGQKAAPATSAYDYRLGEDRASCTFSERESHQELPWQGDYRSAWQVLTQMQREFGGRGRPNNQGADGETTLSQCAETVHATMLKMQARIAKLEAMVNPLRLRGTYVSMD
mmetsp:Transcript_118170/g.335196  ORF Transcript_118170/g.335196 Transcript_118170/m.335196 type:complete len:575 (-) Transcript_118170:277-2001(-)